MANHKSAEKRARQTKKKTSRNISAVSKLKTSMKKLRSSVTGESKEKAAELLKSTTAYAMRLASKKIIHKNNAARKISSISKLYNKMK